MTTRMQPKLTVRRGDIVLVLFPNSNLSSAKTRPALIVQADRVHQLRDFFSGRQT
ncbi:MAG: type II toxin-antitoxin system PemK/MazF family toxin [Xenococcus sp. (in: cyanobacteria)]